MTDLITPPFALTPEQEQFRTEIQAFAAEVIRPAAIQLDKLADPEEVIKPESVLWDVIRQARALGHHTRGLPESVGGTSLGPVENWIFTEVMGWASVGLAIAMAVAGTPFGWIARSGNQDLIDRFVKPYVEDTEARMMGCWAITEPNHGSDTLLFTGEHWNDPAVKGDLTAERDGDEWIIHGQKAPWVSGGTVATHALAFLTVVPGNGMGHGGIAVIPLDLPGVSKGKALNKMGQRDLNQGEIFFDDVHIPSDYMLVPPEAYTMALEFQLTGANAGMGVLFTGLARAAYEEALVYAKERVQGGRPIAEHQLVQKQLFEMFTKVQAATQLSMAALLRIGGGAPSLQHSIASKVFCTQTAFEVASAAVQLHGGYGVTKDAFVEKLFRDARSSLIEDGVNDVLSLLGAGKILQQS